jgi:spore coat protein U-like protein
MEPNMNRTALIAVTVAGMALFGSVTAQAQSATGTIRLMGTVAVNCTVAVTDLSPSLNLVGGETAKQVGTVVENCNSGTGYTVSVASAGKGTLTSTGSGTQPVSFTLGYDGQSSSLSSDLTLNRSTAQFGKSVPVTVTIPANAQRIAGSYSDTLTITIAAK